MDAVIIYKGKYGATRQYAAWLGEELKLLVQDTGTINGEQLNNYDTLIIGSSVYIGKLQIEKWLKNNLSFLRNKKIFFFQVAATPPEQKEKRQVYNETGIPKEIQGNCSFYFLHGRLNIKKLSWPDRLLLKAGASMVKNPTEKKAMLTDYDDVIRVNLNEMIGDIKKYFALKEKKIINNEKEVVV